MRAQTTCALQAIYHIKALQRLCRKAIQLLTVRVHLNNRRAHSATATDSHATLNQIHAMQAVQATLH